MRDICFTRVRRSFSVAAAAEVVVLFYRLITVAMKPPIVVRFMQYSSILVGERLDISGMESTLSWTPGDAKTGAAHPLPLFAAADPLSKGERARTRTVRTARGSPVLQHAEYLLTVLWAGTGYDATYFTVFV